MLSVISELPVNLVGVAARWLFSFFATVKGYQQADYEPFPPVPALVPKTLIWAFLSFQLFDLVVPFYGNHAIVVLANGLAWEATFMSNSKPILLWLTNASCKVEITT